MSLSLSTVSSSVCHEVLGLDVTTLVFWMLSFKPTFSLSIFTFIKKLFNSSFSAISVVPSAYLRLLIFPLTILIFVCASSNPAFHLMYSAQMLNKHGDNIQPWRTPFPIWNQSVVPCLVLFFFFWSWAKFSFFFFFIQYYIGFAIHQHACPVLTVASWPAYRFLKRQVRWSGIPIAWRISSLLWSTQSKALA